MAAGAMTIGDYSRLKVIGRGSFGEAVLVRKKGDHRLYVVKQIEVSRIGDKERAEAEGEVRVLMKLDHPNVVKYRQHFVQDGVLNIVLDFADNGDLAQHIAKAKKAGKRFSEDLVLYWFAQIASAMLYVHSQNILHRDLKTSNIFLTKQNIIKLGDFGIAKMLNSTRDMAKTVIGTPYYMSPELCEDLPYNHKSDVWALGCVLYELTTLNHAFDGANMCALVLKILRGHYDPIPKEYSPELQELIDRMLQAKPAQRPTVLQIIQTPLIQRRIKQFEESEIAKTQRHLVLAHGLSSSFGKGSKLSRDITSSAKRGAKVDAAAAAAAVAAVAASGAGTGTGADSPAVGVGGTAGSGAGNGVTPVLKQPPPRRRVQRTHSGHSQPQQQHRERGLRARAAKLGKRDPLKRPEAFSHVHGERSLLQLVNKAAEEGEGEGEAELDAGVAGDDDDSSGEEFELDTEQDRARAVSASAGTRHVVSASTPRAATTTPFLAGQAARETSPRALADRIKAVHSHAAKLQRRQREAQQAQQAAQGDEVEQPSSFYSSAHTSPSLRQLPASAGSGHVVTDRWGTAEFTDDDDDSTSASDVDAAPSGGEEDDDDDDGLISHGQWHSPAVRVETGQHVAGQAAAAALLGSPEKDDAVRSHHRALEEELEEGSEHFWTGMRDQVSQLTSAVGRRVSEGPDGSAAFDALMAEHNLSGHLEEASVGSEADVMGVVEGEVVDDDDEVDDDDSSGLQQPQEPRRKFSGVAIAALAGDSASEDEGVPANAGVFGFGSYHSMTTTGEGVALLGEMRSTAAQPQPSPPLSGEADAFAGLTDMRIPSGSDDSSVEGMPDPSPEEEVDLRAVVDAANSVAHSAGNSTTTSKDRRRSRRRRSSRRQSRRQSHLTTDTGATSDSSWGVNVGLAPGSGSSGTESDFTYDSEGGSEEGGDELRALQGARSAMPAMPPPVHTRSQSAVLAAHVPDELRLRMGEHRVAPDAHGHVPSLGRMEGVPRVGEHFYEAAAAEAESGDDEDEEDVHRAVALHAPGAAWRSRGRSRSDGTALKVAREESEVAVKTFRITLSDSESDDGEVMIGGDEAAGAEADFSDDDDDSELIAQLQGAAIAEQFAAASAQASSRSVQPPPPPPLPASGPALRSPPPARRRMPDLDNVTAKVDTGQHDAAARRQRSREALERRKAARMAVEQRHRTVLKSSGLKEQPRVPFKQRVAAQQRAQAASAGTGGARAGGSEEQVYVAEAYRGLLQEADAGRQQQAAAAGVRVVPPPPPPVQSLAAHASPGVTPHRRGTALLHGVRPSPLAEARRRHTVMGDDVQALAVPSRLPPPPPPGPPPRAGDASAGTSPATTAPRESLFSPQNLRRSLRGSDMDTSSSGMSSREPSSEVAETEESEERAAAAAGPARRRLPPPHRARRPRRQSAEFVATLAVDSAREHFQVANQMRHLGELASEVPEVAQPGSSPQVSAVKPSPTQLSGMNNAHLLSARDGTVSIPQLRSHITSIRSFCLRQLGPVRFGRIYETLRMLDTEGDSDARLDELSRALGLNDPNNLYAVFRLMLYERVLEERVGEVADDE